MGLSIITALVEFFWVSRGALADQNVRNLDDMRQYKDEIYQNVRNLDDMRQYKDQNVRSLDNMRQYKDEMYQPSLRQTR